MALTISAAAPTILFDFGGTLDSDGVRWSLRFHAAYRSGGGALDFAAFEPLCQRSDQLLATHPRVRALGFRELVELQAELLVGLLPDGAALAPTSLVEPFLADTHAVIRRNRPILERLGRRHRLGIVSNFSGNLAPVLEELELLDLFCCVADSGLFGIQKPDPEIFRHALRELGADPATCWMVGDHPTHDIAPALALRLRGCWLAPATTAAPPGLDPTARIASLPALEALLD
jgi:putative hydrolase of the HAD superfamily